MLLSSYYCNTCGGYMFCEERLTKVSTAPRCMWCASELSKEDVPSKDLEDRLQIGPNEILVPLGVY